jgi:hypothetical protein
MHVSPDKECRGIKTFAGAFLSVVFCWPLPARPVIMSPTYFQTILIQACRRSVPNKCFCKQQQQQHLPEINLEHHIRTTTLVLRKIHAFLIARVDEVEMLPIVRGYGSGFHVLLERAALDYAIVFCIQRTER